MVKSKEEHRLRQILARNIRHLRQERGMTQEDLSFETGISRTYLSDVELGKRNVAVDNIERIARALRVRVEELFVERDNP